MQALFLFLHANLQFLAVLRGLHEGTRILRPVIIVFILLLITVRYFLDDSFVNPILRLF